ncbi:methionyl-tRNA formyltransferase [Spiroplasma endosymbiont of Labia minor]|uniref:methionyl-tRNA formyltransferase n=1 Tax=Spiroplasma endosymbiont of Labia minor TaxID=3066305 RepID=UPI0030CB54FD
MNQKIRVVFFGTSEIAAEILESMLDINIEVVAVVSQPDKSVGRKQVITMTPVKTVALKHNLLIFQPNKVIEIQEKLKKLTPDTIVTCAYGQKLPQEILSICPNKCFNFHASLLPKYRGGAPIQYSIWKGENETGISIMQMIQEMDAGEYYIQRKIIINDNETYATLLKKLIELGKKMVKEDLLKVINNEYTPIKQDYANVTFASIISKDDEHIKVTDSAIEIERQIRAFTPSPGCYLILNDIRYKIIEARLLTVNDHFPVTLIIHPPGHIVHVGNEGITFQTGSKFLVITKIQKEGKKPIDASLYFKNKLPDIKTGMLFK